MGFFNWAAPLIRRYGDRFRSEDAEAIARRLSPAVPPGGRVLDVGGGAGQLAQLLAEELDAHITVLDPTPQMLSHVDVNARVDAVTGTAEAIPFPDSSFDAIVVTDAFHHFRDQPAAAREFARVVRHNGLVLVLDLDPTARAMTLVVLGERLVGEPAAFMSPHEMCIFMAKHGIEGECASEEGVTYSFLGCVQKQAMESAQMPVETPLYSTTMTASE